jgi:peroxiredoxin Q/BCP
MALDVGQKAPEFTLNNQSGESISLAALLKTGPIVLFFFPKAFTKVCTAEACSFGASLDKFENLKTTVVGISTDDEATLSRFKKQYELSYNLLADKKGTIAKKYDAYVPILGFSTRVTYIIGADGLIKGVHSGMLQAEPHIQKTLKQLAMVSQ